jgi:uncharacterized protein YbjT (DUF2867 family)
MTTTIALTGATGGIGGRVARLLEAAGVALRLVVRDPARAPQIAGADVTTGDYADGDAIRAPAGDGRVSAVARDDIADVAAAVLLDEAGTHNGRTYDVTGPEALTIAEIAAVLSDAVGRRITYVPETVEVAYASRASYGAPPWEVDGWVTSYTASAAGEVATVSDTVPSVAGHPATPLAENLARHPELTAALRGVQPSPIQRAWASSS